MDEPYVDKRSQEFSDRIITSYLWCTEPEDMYETVMALMSDAKQFGIEIDYKRFGIIRE